MKTEDAVKRSVCGDNRFEIINKVKKRLLEYTNIEQSPKELEVLDNLLFRLWQCGYFDYIEIFEKNEMTFKEWYKKSDCELTGVSIGIARCIFQAGAKELAKENEQLKREIEQVEQKLDWFLTETIAGKEYRPKEELEELQRENEQLKAQNEKMKRCSNCVHRFVRHFSQEGTCQRPNCKNYSEWCFDGQFLGIEK